MTIGKIVFVGAGAIGGSVAAWLAENRQNVWCYDKPEVLDAIGAKGIAHYDGGKGSSSARTIKLGILRSLEGLGESDLLIFAVKNFSLDAVAGSAATATGGKPIALSMANGIDNQTILPKHFKRCLYAVVGYNAWLDAPGVIGWQNRGPLVIGTPDNSLRPELEAVVAELAKGLEVVARTVLPMPLIPSSLSTSSTRSRPLLVRGIAKSSTLPQCSTSSRRPSMKACVWLKPRVFMSCMSAPCPALEKSVHRPSCLPF